MAARCLLLDCVVPAFARLGFLKLASLENKPRSAAILYPILTGIGCAEEIGPAKTFEPPALRRGVSS